MLAIQKSSTGGEEKCRPHLLPCRLHHDGQVQATQRYWDPKLDSDGSNVSYFRGRKLRGTTLKIPDGYRGIVLEKSDRVVDATEKVAEGPEEDEMNEALEQEEEDEEPPCTAMDEVASFDELVVWAHETQPDASEDPFCKGVNEWINFAQAMHSWGDETRRIGANSGK